MTKALKVNEYYLFVRWLATPEPLREPGTQGEFQQLNNVSHQTLANWKNDPNFWSDITRELKKWGKERTPNVILGLYARASRKGDPEAAKMWLKYIEDFKDPETGNTININQTIIQLPEERKTMILDAFKNYGLLEKQNESSSNLPNGEGNSERSSPAETGG